MPHLSLQEWLDYIQQLHPSEIDMGLERLRYVAQRLRLDQPAPLNIVISGTNGKGSHVAAIDQLLRQLGYRVGTYTSPHLLRYNERICINGAPVDDERLILAFEAIEAVRGDTSLSFFEFGTLAALQILTQTPLDVAILEVGLGGRLDAVNLVDADIAVITSIGLDHQDWLGDTREAIAIEKAGIFRPGIPVVCTESDPPASLLQKIAELNCQLFLRDRDFAYNAQEAEQEVGQEAEQGTKTVGGGRRWQWRGKDSRGTPVTLKDLPPSTLALANVAGALQVTALVADKTCDGDWPERLAQAAPQVLSQLTLAGRQQWARTPLGQQLVLDVSHNTDAARALATTLNQWRAEHPEARVHLVLAMMQDKDHAGYYHALENAIDFWYIAHFDLPRCMPAAKLHAALLAEGAPSARLASSPDVSEALSEACQRAGEGDLIVVSGSFITVSEIMQHIVADNSANRPHQEASSP